MIPEPPEGTFPWRLGRLEKHLDDHERRLRDVEQELAVLRGGLTVGRWLGPMVAALGTGLLIAVFVYLLQSL